MNPPLQDRSARLKDVLNEVLATTISLTRADYGNVQRLNDKGTGLVIAAHYGFSQEFLEHFNFVPIREATSVCGRSAFRGERFMVRDVEADPAFREHLSIARLVPFRAVQSTPILGEDGGLLAMISTHFRQARLPRKDELLRLDLYLIYASREIEWALGPRK